MDEFNYKNKMDEFYSRISSFVSRHETILTELMDKERIFATLQMDETDKKKIFFDWFIFDCKSSVFAKNLLRHFLDTEPLEDETKELYRGFLDNVYSVFEVKALRVGKEMIIRDLLNDKEYNVKETTLTQHIKKGQCALMRVLPFHGYHILTGIGHLFPAESISIIKLFMRNKKKSSKKQNLNPLEICELLFAQDKRERLPVQERFKLFCQEAGLENAYIDEIIKTLKQRAENPKESFNGDLLKDIMSKIKSYSGGRVEELSGAFMELWNSLISEGNPSARKGPIETAIIHAGINYVQAKVNPDKYKDIKKAEAKAKEVNDQWLNTPKEELGNRTPVEVILEERRELGNPQKEVGFQVSLTKLEMNPEIEKQAEKLFYQGIEYVRQHKPVEALKAYEAYCQLNPDNHVVWQNMGVAHILLLDKVKAQECFQRALEINPDYEMPRRNLKMLKSATEEDIMRMAEENKVQWFNKGKVV